MTTATPVLEVLFPITEELQKNAPITIASLQKLAPEQLVDFKAEVCAVSAMKKLSFKVKIVSESRKSFSETKQPL